MNVTQDNRAQFCCNVMETLVNQEIKQQFLEFSPRLTQYINKIEVMTYAMNRLPALYASSEKGWQHQMSRGKNEFALQITIAVRQGLAAVLRDPLRVAIALKPQEVLESETALQELKELLQDEKLAWKNLVLVIEQTLHKTARGEITWKPRRRTPVLHYSRKRNNY